MTSPTKQPPGCPVQSLRIIGWGLLVLLCPSLFFIISSIQEPSSRELDSSPLNNSATEEIVLPKSPTNGISEQDSQLRLLYDYTLFHIGVYITLATGILAALKYKTTQWRDLFYIPALIYFALAGSSGGIICSHIPDYVSYSSGKTLLDVGNETKEIVDVQPFLTDTYSVLSFENSFADWIMWEHLYFWSGVSWLIILLIAQTCDEKFFEGTDNSQYKKVTVEIKANSINVTPSETV